MIRKDFIISKTREHLAQFINSIAERVDKPRRKFIQLCQPLPQETQVCLLSSPGRPTGIVSTMQSGLWPALTGTYKKRVIAWVFGDNRVPRIGISAGDFVDRRVGNLAYTKNRL